MKKIVLFFGSLIFSFALLAQVKYTSPLGNFKINFPNSPEYTNSNIDSESGTIKLHIFTSSDASNVFMVACADYPGANLSSEESRNTFINNAASGFFGEMNMSYDEIKGVKYGKFKGKEFSGVSSDYVVLYRLIVANNTVFQVAIMTTGTVINKKVADSFFKSFKITIK